MAAMRIRFDRGTLLLEDIPQGLDARGLPGVLWDPRVRAFRAPACKWAELRPSLEAALGAGSLEVSWRDRVAPGPTGPWRAEALALRPYQAAAIDAWQRAERRGVVVLPTGSGKTRVGMAAMAAAGLPALCLVPTRVLMHQWADALEGAFGGAVGRLGDGRRQLGPVTVATYESAWRQMDRIGDRFGLLVVDEAHHFGGGLRDEALEMALAPARLGLTATPPEDGEPARDRLEALVGPVVYRRAVDELAGRWLASYEHVTLEVELTREERRAYEWDMAAFRAVYGPFRRAMPGASWADFTRAAIKTDAGRRALAGWRRARKRVAYGEAKAGALRGLLARHAGGADGGGGDGNGGADGGGGDGNGGADGGGGDGGARVLVFTADNDSAYAIAREHLVMPITCDIGKAERDEVLARFRRGELRVLVSARVLNEGLDVPDADVAIVVGASLGAREHVQRVGRLLRPAPGKRAVIYELVARDTAEERRARDRRKGLTATRPEAEEPGAILDPAV